jgi:hypothetical protein
MQGRQAFSFVENGDDDGEHGGEVVSGQSAVGSW